MGLHVVTSNNLFLFVWNTKNIPTLGFTGILAASHLYHQLHHQVLTCSLSSTSSYDSGTRSWFASQWGTVHEQFRFGACGSGSGWSGIPSRARGSGNGYMSDDPVFALKNMKIVRLDNSWQMENWDLRVLVVNLHIWLTILLIYFHEI